MEPRHRKTVERAGAVSRSLMATARQSNLESAEHVAASHEAVDRSLDLLARTARQLRHE